MNVKAFEESLGYAFLDPSLLEMALTHRSYAFEHGPNHCDNQRLEFLGDAVLDFVIAEALYLAYPDLHEGELSRLRSRLVCEPALCLLAKKYDFEANILMGKGEISASGMLRSGTLADAYEAVIGAIYLDGGFDAAKNFILRAVFNACGIPLVFHGLHGVIAHPVPLPSSARRRGEVLLSR